MFFVLSGYLITDLLAAQFDSCGLLDLRGFWARRARRLLPALALVLLTVTAAVTLFERDQLGSLRTALLGAVTFSSNWSQVVTHQPYFSVFGPPPPLRNLWSLAIEGQFYLIWALVMAVILAGMQRRRLRAAIAWTGAAASAVAMAVIYVPGTDPSRVYYGTDTHSSALLIGAALALTWPLARLSAASRETTRWLDFTGVLGLVALAWAVTHFSGNDHALYPFGLVFAALAAGAVVVAAAVPGLVAAALSWPPLRWVGVRSYGIYLWQWPVVALFPAIAGSGASLLEARLVETTLPIVLAAASWRWVEEPILRRGFRAVLRDRGAVIGRAYATGRRSPLRALPLVMPAAVVAVACTAAYGVLTPPGPALPAHAQAAGSRGRAATRSAVASAALPVTGSMVTAVGDSVMLAAAPELRAALPGIYVDAAASRPASAGIAEVRMLAQAGGLRPVVLIGLGTSGAVTMAQIRQLRAELGPQRWLVLVNTYRPGPGQAAVNATMAAAASRYPRVLLANWHSAVKNDTNVLWVSPPTAGPAGRLLYADVAKAAIETIR